MPTPEQVERAARALYTSLRARWWECGESEAEAMETLREVAAEVIAALAETRDAAEVQP
jgi:hypothetical protein